MFHRYIYFKLDEQVQEALLHSWREALAHGPDAGASPGSSHQLERRCEDARTWMEVYRNYPDLLTLDAHQEAFDRIWLGYLEQLAPGVQRQVETFRQCA